MPLSMVAAIVPSRPEANQRLVMAVSLLWLNRGAQPGNELSSRLSRPGGIRS
jgi:hypothetical protein